MISERVLKPNCEAAAGRLHQGQGPGLKTLVTGDLHTGHGVLEQF